MLQYCSEAMEVEQKVPQTKLELYRARGQDTMLLEVGIPNSPARAKLRG